MLYQGPVVGLSQQQEDNSAFPFGSEEDNELILYLCITAVAVAAFYVIALFIKKSLAAKEKTDTDSQEDDFGNLCSVLSHCQNKKILVPRREAGWIFVCHYSSSDSQLW